MLPESFTHEARERIHKLFGIKDGEQIESLAEGLNTSTAISAGDGSSGTCVQFLLPHIFGLYDVVVNGGQDRDNLRMIGDFEFSRPTKLACARLILRRGCAPLGANPSKRSGNG